MSGTIPTGNPKSGSDPFISEKKFVQIVGFMVFKSTGLDSRFQRKNRFWKICTETQDIIKKVSKISLPNQTSKIWHILADISMHIFQNLFLRWNRESKPVDLNTMNPIIQRIFFSHLYRGQSHFQYGFSKGRWSRKTLKFWEVYFFIHWNDISLGQNQRWKFLQIGTP